MDDSNSPNPNFIPNPDRPRYYDLSNGILKNLDDTNVPYFERNDLVWMAFKLGFVVTGDQWWPEIIPIELVRVGKVASQINVRPDLTQFPALDDDYAPLEVGGRIALIDGNDHIITYHFIVLISLPTEPVRGQKRKNRDDDEPTQTPPKKRATSEDDMLIVDMDSLTVDAAESSSEIATSGKHKLRSKGAKERSNIRV